jgi:hypothetical protein
MIRPRSLARAAAAVLAPVVVLVVLAAPAWFGSRRPADDPDGFPELPPRPAGGPLKRGRVPALPRRAAPERPSPWEVHLRPLYLGVPVARADRTVFLVAAVHPEDWTGPPAALLVIDRPGGRGRWSRAVTLDRRRPGVSEGHVVIEPGELDLEPGEARATATLAPGTPFEVSESVTFRFVGPGEIVRPPTPGEIGRRDGPPRAGHPALAAAILGPFEFAGR